MTPRRVAGLMAGLAAAALLPLCRLPASSSSLTGALADPPGCAGALVHDSRRRAPARLARGRPGGSTDARLLVWQCRQRHRPGTGAAHARRVRARRAGLRLLVTEGTAAGLWAQATTCGWRPAASPIYPPARRYAGGWRGVPRRLATDLPDTAADRPLPLRKRMRRCACTRRVATHSTCS